MSRQESKQVLLEIYKLHAELAEQAAASREGLNKLYTGMVSSIVAASVLFQRVAPEAKAVWMLPALGIIVSLCWLLSLHSMTGKLSAKHEVLLELEAELPFQFFEREEAKFGKAGPLRRKWSGAAIPVIFLVMCIACLLASDVG